VLYNNAILITPYNTVISYSAQSYRFQCKNLKRLPKERHDF